MRSNLPARFALAAIALALMVSWTSRAEAGKTQLGFDLEWASADQESETSSGFGGGLRLGYEIDALVLSVIPEIGGTYHSFSDLDTSVYRGVVGGRLRFLNILEPGLYAHFGVGHSDSDRELVPAWTGATADGGISLDLTILPVFEFGGHAGYTVLWGEGERDALTWWNAGLQAAVVF